MKWEYKVIKNQKVIKRDNKELTGQILIDQDRFLPIDKLNQLGDEGWELIIYFEDLDRGPYTSTALFKRPKNRE